MIGVFSGRGRPNTTYIDTLKRNTGAFEEAVERSSGCPPSGGQVSEFLAL